MKSGIIAIKLREGDELVDVVVTKPGDELVLSTAHGMAIRFKQSDARPDGPQLQRRERHLAGRRRPRGGHGRGRSRGDAVDRLRQRLRQADALRSQPAESRVPRANRRTPTTRRATEDDDEAIDDVPDRRRRREEAVPRRPAVDEADEGEGEGHSSQHSYRTQRRGGKGLRDIKTTDRNGPVIGVVRVGDEDELLMMTARGKIQRIRASDVSIIGRNTQGVRIMSLDDDDALVAVKRVPREEEKEEKEENGKAEEG